MTVFMVLIRKALAWLIHRTTRVCLPLSLRLMGYRRAVIGKCVFWVPAERMDLILSGVERLAQLDREIACHLRALQDLMFWYHSTRYVRCASIFTITDSFLAWGTEGVMACLVQSLMI